MSLLEAIRAYMARSKNPSAVDEFISLEGNGHARFDLAGYLSSEEGRKRVADMSNKVEAEAAKKATKAA